MLACGVLNHATTLAQHANKITWAFSDATSLRVGLDETVVNNVHFDLLGFARDYAVQRGGDRNSVSV